MIDDRYRKWHGSSKCLRCRRLLEDGDDYCICNACIEAVLEMFGLAQIIKE